MRGVSHVHAAVRVIDHPEQVDVLGRRAEQAGQLRDQPLVHRWRLPGGGREGGVISRSCIDGDCRGRGEGGVISRSGIDGDCRGEGGEW